MFAEPQPAQLVGSVIGASADGSVIAAQSSQYQTGMRWPHQIWRLMLQSRMFSIQWKYVRSKRCGTNLMRPSRTASMAGLGERLRAHEPLLREQRLDDGAGALAVADGVRVRLDLLHQPARLEVRDDPLARLEAVEAGIDAGALVHACRRGR